MSRNLWIGLIVVIVLVLAGWYLTRPKQDMTPTPVAVATPSTEMASPSSSSSAAIEQNVVTISSNGFSPGNITIKAGETVAWMNSDSANHTVNSAPHPTHTAYPPLNLGNVQPGGKVSLIFPKPGTYAYHDHLNPSLTGSVTVE